MPEGHSVHRIARQFGADFLGKDVEVSSPQGRFSAGAELISGHELTRSQAVGKQLFLHFGPDKILRVHLGIYGAWDFAGELTALGTSLESSIGAPRLARAVHIGEEEKDRGESKAADAQTDFPPDPVGQVRARLLTATAVADLRGPTACEVLNPDEVVGVLNKLGPDPANNNSPAAKAEIVTRVQRRKVPIARLLMDQQVFAGVGNIYRAELLYRAGLNPFITGAELQTETIEALWDDWAEQLELGIRTGKMMTRDDLTDEEFAEALTDQTNRHWVYGRANQPCRTCGTPIAMELLSARKLYWCPHCQRR